MFTNELEEKYNELLALATTKDFKNEELKKKREEIYKLFDKKELLWTIKTIKKTIAYFEKKFNKESLNLSIYKNLLEEVRTYYFKTN